MEALLVLTTEDSRMFRPELLSTSTHTLILTVFTKDFPVPSSPIYIGDI